MPCGSLLYFDCLRNVLRRRAGRKGLVFPFRLSVSSFYALRKAVFALRINGGSPFGLCYAAMQGSISETGAGCPCGDVWRRRRGRAGFFSGCSGCLCGVYCGKGRRKRSDAESGDCRAAENVSATGCREEVGMLFGTVAVGLHPAFEREKAFSVFMRRCGREPKRG